MFEMTTARLHLLLAIALVLGCLAAALGDPPAADARCRVSSAILA